MSVVEYPDLEQRSDEWFRVRRGLVTASTVGKLITGKLLKPADNDYSRAFTAQLVAERVTGHTEPSYTNEHMWRGILHEQFAVDAYTLARDVQVESCGFIVRTEDDWTLGYSPDGLVGDDGLIEVKCPQPKVHLRTILEDRVPPEYMPQLQAGLLVTGRAWVDYISFVGGMPLYTKRIEPDDKWQTAIVAACRQFETNARHMTDIYQIATADLPPTERVPDEIAI